MTEQERTDLANMFNRAMDLGARASRSYRNSQIEREQLKGRMARVLSRKFGSLPQSVVLRTDAASEDEYLPQSPHDSVRS